MGMYNGNKSFNLRLWHWLSVIAMFGLITTSILRMTVLGRANAVIIQDKLAEVGIELADGKAGEISKILMENMWQAHYYFGFLLAALLLFRLYAFLSKQDKFPSCQVKDSDSTEFKAVKHSHTIFYLFVAYETISGLLLFFRKTLGIAKESVGWVKESHELLFWFFVAFVVAHIIGVIKAEITNSKGLISEMFNGGKKD